MATSDKGLTHWQRIETTVTKQFLNGANDFSNCFSLLLKLVNARHSAREIAEVLPYYEKHMDLSEFLNSLARLGFKATTVPCALADIPETALPCLFVPAGGSSFVVLGRVGAQVRVTTSIDQEPYLHANALLTGHAYFIHPVDIAANERQPVRAVLRRFSAQFLQSGVAELFAGFLLVTSPLFSMAIYTAVIPSGATDTLLYLGVGTAVAVALSFLFTRYRIAILSLVTGRVDFLFGTMVTGQLLKMPVAYTEGASVGTQTARLQGFESIRDMFSGPLAATILDLPVTLVFLIVLALINPMALIVFVGVIAAYAFLYLIYEPMVSRESDSVGVAVNARSEFLTESAHKMRLIKETGVEQIWFKRFKDISAQASMLMYQSEKTATRIGALSHLFMMLSALMIIAISVPLVISGSIGAGALVASTMLMWRILTPIQMFFSNLRRFNNIKNAVRQIDGLMGIQGERFDTTNAVSRLMAGKVEFSKVSFRYAQSADPALVGVDFSLRHGQCVALTGPDGGGKSTLFKLLLGLYPPQGGAILIDGIDIRQLTPFEIRRRIGYMPEDRSHMFRATIAQNMRLVRPEATDDDILAALELAGGLEQVLRLPNKLDYRSGDNKQDLSISTRRKFALARAYLAGASILLLDEPTSGLDPVADQKFAEFLTAVKGKITVIFVSHKPAHIRLADTLMVFENGYLRATGAPNDLLKPPPAGNGSRS
jgi:ATP-binding cassette subfamily B protein